MLLRLRHAVTLYVTRPIHPDPALRSGREPHIRPARSHSGQHEYDDKRTGNQPRAGYSAAHTPHYPSYRSSLRASYQPGMLQRK